MKIDWGFWGFWLGLAAFIFPYLLNKRSYWQAVMCDVMENMEDESVLAAVREKVGNLCARFPVYS